MTCIVNRYLSHQIAKLAFEDGPHALILLYIHQKEYELHICILPPCFEVFNALVKLS